MSVQAAAFSIGQRFKLSLLLQLQIYLASECECGARSDVKTYQSLVRCSLMQHEII